MPPKKVAAKASCQLYFFVKLNSKEGYVGPLFLSEKELKRKERLL
jgi:hypothetical protein